MSPICISLTSTSMFTFFCGFDPLGNTEVMARRITALEFPSGRPELGFGFFFFRITNTIV